MAENSATPPVKCPNCSAVLRFKTAPKPTAFVTCPLCKSRRPVGDYVALAVKTPPQTPPPMPQSRPGVLEFAGALFPLARGRNVVGRKASTSTATLQLPDESRYMSREHFVVEVSAASSGRLRHELTLYKDNVQPTWVNSMPLMHGERVELHHGDKIMVKPMGGNPLIIAFVNHDEANR